MTIFTTPRFLSSCRRRSIIHTHTKHPQHWSPSYHGRVAGRAASLILPWVGNTRLMPEINYWHAVMSICQSRITTSSSMPLTFNFLQGFLAALRSSVPVSCLLIFLKFNKTRKPQVTIQVKIHIKVQKLFVLVYSLYRMKLNDIINCKKDITIFVYWINILRRNIESRSPWQDGTYLGSLIAAEIALYCKWSQTHPNFQKLSCWLYTVTWFHQKAFWKPCIPTKFYELNLKLNCNFLWTVQSMTKRHYSEGQFWRTLATQSSLPILILETTVQEYKPTPQLSWFTQRNFELDLKFYGAQRITFCCYYSSWFIL